MINDDDDDGWITIDQTSNVNNKLKTILIKIKNKS